MQMAFAACIGGIAGIWGLKPPLGKAGNSCNRELGLGGLDQRGLNKYRLRGQTHCRLGRGGRMGTEPALCKWQIWGCHGGSWGETVSTEGPAASSPGGGSSASVCSFCCSLLIGVTMLMCFKEKKKQQQSTPLVI